MKTAAILLCVFIAAQSGGCASAVILGAGITAGVGLATSQAEAYVNGELKAARLVQLEVAEHAALLALAELETSIKVHKRDSHRVYVMAKADGGPDIRVTMTHKTPVVTKYEIRIGMMGDQAISRLVMARIDTMLGIEHLFIPVEDSPIVAPRPPPPSTVPVESRPPDEPPP